MRAGDGEDNSPQGLTPFPSLCSSHSAFSQLHWVLYKQSDAVFSFFAEIQWVASFNASLTLNDFSSNFKVTHRILHSRYVVITVVMEFGHAPVILVVWCMLVIELNLNLFSL